MYVTEQEYIAARIAVCAEPLDGVEPFLVSASDAVDVLTFHRIQAAGGIDTLTPFQRDTIKRVTCALAEFMHDNQEAIGSPVSAYNINGVSVQYGGTATVSVVNGVMIPRALHHQLLATGLCDRRV
ncbi:MAG: hypothetical protein KBS74_03670 [Clostridiales bacterium]|nr:hypothetical protein [Candidatus Cacconaster stercorequi]